MMMILLLKSLLWFAELVSAELYHSWSQTDGFADLL
jgi:hypothetical protein